MLNSNYSYKNIWNIAFPIILGSLAQDLITIIDTIFIGKLGAISLGAAAIGGIFYLSIIMIGWGFGIGVQIIIARRFGEGKISEINTTLAHAFIILMTIAVFVFILVYNFSTPIFNRILLSQDISIEAERFINIRIFGIFAAFTNIVFRAFYIGVSKTKAISYSTILMAIINIGLDYILIYGNDFIKPLHIEGAALASVIAEYCALIYFIYYTKTNTELLKFKLFKPIKWNKNAAKNILKIATPSMLQNFISFVAWFIFFVFVEKMGEIPIAVSNIIRSIYIIFLLPIWGFASATNTLVSYSIGKNESQLIPKIIGRSLSMALFGVLICVSISSIFSMEIIGIFSQSNDIIYATLPAFKVIMGASFFLAFGLILFQAVSATGNTKVALFIETVVISAYLGIIYWIVNNTEQTIEQIWKMEFVYGSGLAILSVLYLRFGNWKKKKI